MRNCYSIVISIFVIFLSAQSIAQVKIGDNPTTINSNSLLELESTDKGFVLPRVSLTNTSSSSPLTANLLTGTLVYNTNAALPAGTGLYYWNGTSWNLLRTTTGKAWRINGNDATNSGINFLGTKDSAGLSLRTANTEAVHIDSLQNVSIGTNTTGYKFEEAGTFRMHKDSFNVMYSPDILPEFAPGIIYAGAVFNPDDGGKILNGIVSLPNNENIAVTGYINPSASEQSLFSAENGDISLSCDNPNGQGNVDIGNGQVFARTTSTSGDTSNHLEMSYNQTSLSREVNAIGKTNVMLQDSTISLGAGESMANSRLTGVNISPAFFSLYNNDNFNRQNSNFGLGSTQYFLNIADSNRLVNSSVSEYADKLLTTVSYSSPQLNTSLSMDSTMSLALNSTDQNSGISIKANDINLYRNRFATNKSSAINLSLDSLNLSLSKPASNTNFILSDKTASFTSNNTFNLSIGNNAPLANLDVTGSIRSSNLGGGGTVLADNNGILYASSTLPKSAENFDYSIPASTTVPSSLLSIISSTLSAGKLDLTINFPSDLSNTNVAVSVWPKQDLPDNVAIAFTRILSTSQMKIRFLNYGTLSQPLSGEIHITVTEF